MKTDFLLDKMSKGPSHVTRTSPTLNHLSRRHLRTEIVLLQSYLMRQKIASFRYSHVYPFPRGVTTSPDIWHTWHPLYPRGLSSLCRDNSRDFPRAGSALSLHLSSARPRSQPFPSRPFRCFPTEGIYEWGEDSKQTTFRCISLKRSSKDFWVLDCRESELLVVGDLQFLQFYSSGRSFLISDFRGRFLESFWKREFFGYYIKSSAIVFCG